MEQSRFRRQKPPSFWSASAFRWDRVSRDAATATLLAGMLGLVASLCGDLEGLTEHVQSAAALFDFLKIRLAIVALALLCAHMLVRSVVYRFRDEKGSNNNHAGELKAALKTAFLAAVNGSCLNPGNEGIGDHGAV